MARKLMATNKKYILLISLILVGIILYFVHDMNLFYTYINSPKQEYIHSIVVRNYREDKRDIANQCETEKVLDLLKRCKYDGKVYNPNPGLIDPQYVKFYIDSKDYDVFPHIAVVLYQDKGSISGFCEIEHEYFKITNCSELYSYAFKITDDK